MLSSNSTIMRFPQVHASECNTLWGDIHMYSRCNVRSGGKIHLNTEAIQVMVANVPSRQFADINLDRGVKLYSKYKMYMQFCKMKLKYIIIN